MRTLFIYPEFPKTFWSYEKILELVDSSMFNLILFRLKRCSTCGLSMVRQSLASFLQVMT